MFLKLLQSIRLAFVEFCLGSVIQSRPQGKSFKVGSQIFVSSGSETTEKTAQEASFFLCFRFFAQCQTNAAAFCCCLQELGGVSVHSSVFQPAIHMCIQYYLDPSTNLLLLVSLSLCDPLWLFALLAWTWVLSDMPFYADPQVWAFAQSGPKFRPLWGCPHNSQGCESNKCWAGFDSWFDNTLQSHKCQ